MSPPSILTPPAWASPVIAGITAVLAVALAAGIGYAAPLVLLSIPAAIIGYRTGWHTGCQTAPRVGDGASGDVEDTPLQILPDPIPSAAQPADRIPYLWVDEVAVLERMGGSIEILMELTALFVDENVRRLVDLRAALVAGDALQVSRETHGIKSGLTNFCADEAVALTHDIEKTAKAGSLEGLAAAIDVLAIVLQEVTDQLTAMGKAA